MLDDHILSVSALTAAIKGTLEASFPFVWVRGQVMNLSRPSSGHLYFSLRDEESSLAAVWFKGNQKEGERFDPLTGEVYEEGPRESLAVSLENGQEVVCAGRIAVYGPRGVYQLVVEIAQDAGRGRLHEEFERLRTKLGALGYFSLERKRPLPENPVRTAVVTAPAGAAVHDFLRLAEGRGLSGTIRIYPALVQGDAAPGAITAALARIWAEGWAQVAVLIRGGGSLEDLWAFNDERVARAVFSSPIPVLAGIGHEVDFTLADMTADMRAATPSHAAQLLWPDRMELHRQWQTRTRALELAGARFQERFTERLNGFERTLAWASPARRLSGWEDRLAAAKRLLESAGRLMLKRAETRFETCAGMLAGAPKRLPGQEERRAELERRLAASKMFGITRKEALLGSLAGQVARVPERLPARRHALETLRLHLENSGERLLNRAETGLERCLLRLEAVNPHAPLERGYALARKQDGAFVRMTRDVAPGESLQLVVSNGEIPVRVEGENA